MALSIQISDANFSQVVASLSLPDRSGLVAEYTFGESQTKSIVNRAAPALASMTAIGAAAYGANYAEIKSGGAYGSIGFDTGLKPPVDATMILVVRNTTACPAYMSDGAGYFGFHNYLSQPSLYNSQSGTFASVAEVANPAHTDFAFYAGQLPLGGKGVIYTYTGGVLTTNTAETNGGARGAATIKIGSTLANSGTGVARMAYAAMFDRVLSGAEIAAAYTSLKAYLATRGVTVS